MKENNNKTIFITGASSGIGRETAVRLAAEGYTVFAGIRKKIDKQEIESLNKNIKGVYLDITNSGSIEKAFWYIMHQSKKIDVLINNAGIAIAGPVECINIKRLKEQFDVNTFGAVAVCQKFIPMLYNGRIINISSMASTGLFPFLSPYCASKRALDIIFNSFSLENKDKIKVITIKPASIKTPIWNKSVNAVKQDFNDYKETQKKKYINELTFLEQNALNNNKKAIETYVVVDTILKAIKAKNPKPVYNVGFMSIIADILTKFPISFTNKLIKFKLKDIKH